MIDGKEKPTVTDSVILELYKKDAELTEKNCELLEELKNLKSRFEKEIERRNGTSWDSVREKWTVQCAIGLLIVFVVAIIGAIFLLQDGTAEALTQALGGILLAILGYLFGYVPTKSSLESEKLAKDELNDRVKLLDAAVENYRIVGQIRSSALEQYQNLCRNV